MKANGVNMAEGKLCPLKAGAVQTWIMHPDYHSQSFPSEEAARAEIARLKEHAQGLFGMCDRKKCAMWATYLDLNSKERGYCGLKHKEG